MKNRYNTKQREKILSYLKENKDSNITADEILKYFKNIGDNIGKATVYIYLNELVKQNIIKKYNLENRNCRCFQYVEEKHCEEHYHLKCEKCNKIIHLECDEIKEIQKHLQEEHKFEIDSRKTVLYGICDKCKQK